MTTYNFDTIWFEWTEDPDTGSIIPTNGGTGVAEIVAKDNVQLTYSVISSDPEDGVTLDFSLGQTYYDAVFYGGSFYDLATALDIKFYVAEFTFAGGNVSTVLQYDFVTGYDADTGAASGTRISLQIAGDALPYINDVSDLIAIDASIVGVTFGTGAFAPGQSFGWGDLNPYWSTEIDQIWGTGGDDILRGGAGNDYISGGLGNDTLFGGDGQDILGLHSGSGNVTVNFATGTATYASGEIDTFSGFEGVRGSFDDDVVLGTKGSQKFYASWGSDTIDGGAGIDTFVSDEAASSVRLKTGIATTTNSSVTTLRGIENVTGSFEDDLLLGNRRANELRGNDGDDVIKGLGGNDLLDGGNGNDILVGGNGADAFVFDYSMTYQKEKDVITDFRPGQGDHIAIASSDITGLWDLKNNHATEVNGNVIIQVNDDVKLVLKGVALSQLKAADFTFADPYDILI